MVDLTQKLVRFCLAAFPGVQPLPHRLPQTLQLDALSDGLEGRLVEQGFAGIAAVHGLLEEGQGFGVAVLLGSEDGEGVGGGGVEGAGVRLRWRRGHLLEQGCGV